MKTPGSKKAKPPSPKAKPPSPKAKPPSPKAKPPSQTRRTLGPVSDLERHLPADWWRSLFNSLYLKTDGDVVENARNTVRDIEAIECAAGLKKDMRILDLCCGQGRHSLELARRGYTQVTGLDRSRYLIRLARQRAAREGLALTFKEGDARRIRLSPGAFDRVLIMGNSFGYFESMEDDLHILAQVKKLLIPGGMVVLDITDGDWMRSHFEPRSWEWIDQSHLVCRERVLAEDGQRLISREVISHVERGVIIDQFYAERLYSAEELGRLLDQAGFSGFERRDCPDTESERGQDLGMMQQRLMVTALSPRARKTTAAPRVAAFPRVTVVLGDPRLPDQVKLTGGFNDDDLATVARLKEALGRLDCYEFEYLDDHATLLERLKADPPAFVFNLCDEGYQNNAFLEAHVPALLEMLGVPYTGAAPPALTLCYNKSQVRVIAASMDIPVPLETYYAHADQSATLPGFFPALLKPNCGDSSLGITKDAVVRGTEELMEYLNRLRQELPDRAVLVQEFLEGAEYSVGLVGNPGVGLRLLPILEVDYSNLPEGLPPILGYESKWMPDSPYWEKIAYREAALSEEMTRLLQDYSILLFERLGCRDYARMDFRCDAGGVVKLLEVNPNPGWCWDGKLNIMAGLDGLSYAELLELILEAAQERVSLAARPAEQAAGRAD